VEVDEQAEGLAKRTKVGDHLRHVDVREAFDGFELDDESPAYQEVYLAVTDRLPSVLKGHGDLPLEWDATMSQLESHGALVDRFKESWTERPVNLDAGADDSPDHLVELRFRLRKAFGLGVLAVHSGLFGASGAPVTWPLSSP
jgi:hypothetical protein